MRPRTRWVLWMLAAAVALTALMAALRFWRGPGPIPPDVLPPRLDSVLVAQHARAVVLDSVHAAARVRGDSLQRESAERDAREAALVRQARAAEARGDAFAEVARTLGDTAGAAYQAAEAYRASTVALTAALTAADSTIAAERARADLWRTLHDSSDAHARATLAVATELREAVDRAAARRRPRDWSVAITAGPGCTIALDGARSACGATVGIGVTRRLF